MTDEIVTAPAAETVQPIAEYNKTEAALGFLRQRMANVEYDVTTTKGMAVAVADRAEVRGLRTALEAKRKELKAPALDYAKRIDSEAKRITAALLELEDPIDAQIKAEQARKEAEKAERERLERERITAIHARISEIRGFVPLARECRTSERMAGLLDRMNTHWVSFNHEADFEEFGSEAQSAFISATTDIEALIAAKQADEMERALLKQAQEQAAAVLAAAEAAQKAAADKLATEREAFAKEVAEFKAFQSAKLAESAALADAAAAQAKLEEQEAAQVMVVGEVVDAEIDRAELVPVQVLPVIEMAVIDSKVTVSKGRVYPTDDQIITCLASEFGASPAAILTWIEQLDMPALWAKALDAELV